MHYVSKKTSSVKWCEYQTTNDLLYQSVRFKSQTFRSLPKHQNPSAIVKQWSAMRIQCSSACTLGYPRAVLHSQASMRRNSLLYIHSVFLSMPAYGRVPLEQISRCFLTPHYQNPVYQVFVFLLINQLIRRIPAFACHSWRSTTQIWGFTFSQYTSRWVLFLRWTIPCIFFIPIFNRPFADVLIPQSWFKTELFFLLYTPDH